MRNEHVLVLHKLHSFHLAILCFKGQTINVGIYVVQYRVLLGKEGPFTKHLWWDLLIENLCQQLYILGCTIAQFLVFVSPIEMIRDDPYPWTKPPIFQR